MGGEHPDALAAIDVDGRAWSYGELGDRVDRTSRWLQSIGIGAGDPMAIVAGNSVGFLAATLAAAQVGVRYTLVNRHLAPPEIDYIVHDCGARLVVTDAALAPVAGGLGVDAVALDAGSTEPDVTRRRRRRPAGRARRPTASPARSCSTRRDVGPAEGRPEHRRRRPRPRTPPTAPAYVLRRFGIDPSARRSATGVHLVTSPLYHSAPIANAIARAPPRPHSSSSCRASTRRRRSR